MDNLRKIIREAIEDLSEESKLTRDELMDILENKYNIGFVRTTEDFNGGKGGIWLSGENHDKMPGTKDDIFNYYSESNDYVIGVHKDFEKFLNDNGWFSEWNDAGTIMIWPN